MADTSSEIALAHAAHSIGVSWHRAYRLILTGEIEARFVAGRWLVNEASLGKYLKQHGSRLNRSRDLDSAPLGSDDTEAPGKASGSAD